MTPAVVAAAGSGPATGCSKPSLERLRQAHTMGAAGTTNAVAATTAVAACTPLKRSSRGHYFSGAERSLPTVSTRGKLNKEYSDAMRGQDHFEWPAGLPPYFDGDFWPMEATQQMAADARVQQSQGAALAHQQAVSASGQGKPDMSFAVGGAGAGISSGISSGGSSYGGDAAGSSTVDPNRYYTCSGGGQTR